MMSCTAVNASIAIILSTCTAAPPVLVFLSTAASISSSCTPFQSIALRKVACSRCAVHRAVRVQ